MDFPVGQYKTIYLDPPWPERGGGKIKRGADRHYKLMTVKEIQALPIINLVHPDGAHIYLWVTNNYLQAGLDRLRAWQFEYITTITWMKDRQGLGQYYRGLTEHCLFGSTKKRLPYRLTEDGRRCQGVTGFLEAKTVHSAKPDKMREMIETVSHPPRIELFARKHFAGWDVWGGGLEETVDRFAEFERLYRQGLSDREIARIVLGSKGRKSIVARWRERCGYLPHYLPGGRKSEPLVTRSWCELLAAKGSRGFYRNCTGRRELPPKKTKPPPW